MFFINFFPENFFQKYVAFFIFQIHCFLPKFFLEIFLKIGEVFKGEGISPTPVTSLGDIFTTPPPQNPVKMYFCNT